MLLGLLGTAIWTALLVAGVLGIAAARTRRSRDGVALIFGLVAIGLVMFASWFTFAGPFIIVIVPFLTAVIITRSSSLPVRVGAVVGSVLVYWALVALVPPLLFLGPLLLPPVCAILLIGAYAGRTWRQRPPVEVGPPGL